MLNNKYKSLLSQSAFYGLGIFLMKGISLVMLPVYTHYLSPEDYGRLEVLVVLANVCSIIFGFGLVEALCRFVGLASDDDEKKKYAGECLFLAIVVAIICFAIFWFFSIDIALWLPGGVSETEVFLLGIALAVGGLINVPLAWLRINDRAITFFQITMLKVVLQVLLTLYWFSKGLAVFSVLAAGAVSSVIVALILCVLQFRQTGLNFSFCNFVDISKYAYPILIGGLATFVLSGMDRWLLAEYFGAKEIAAYAIAIKFALVPSLLIQPFTLWWLPKRFSVLKEPDGLGVNAHFSMLGAEASVLICGVVGLVGPYLIQVLTPVEYHQAIQILPWLLLCALIKMIAELLNLGCFVDKNSQIQMKINCFSCGVGAALMLVLIPILSITGALLSLLMANTVRLVLFYYFSQKRLYLPYKFGYLFTAFGASVVAMWLGQLVESSTWLVLN